MENFHRRLVGKTFVSCYMVKYYEKKEKEINRHIFEILRPKPKLTKNKFDNK